MAFHGRSPDDEVLLTGGTIAWLSAAAGRRVMVVVACDGDVWPGPNQRTGGWTSCAMSATILGAYQAC